MSFETIWRELRDELVRLDPESILVTPATDRPFVVEETTDDRIVAAFRERDEDASSGGRGSRCSTSASRSTARS
jgi:hypothetical protein